MDKNISKKLFLSLIIFFTLFIVFLLPKSVYADTFTISGTVKNSSGVAIQNSTVAVNDANSDTTSTDSSGNYALTIPSGTYNIQVTPPSGSGYSPAIAMNQTINGAKVTNFILTPVGNVILSGHVFDENGSPVSGQKVTFNSITSTTNSLGEYSISSAPTTKSLSISDVNVAPDYSRKVPTSYTVTVSSFALTQITMLDITIPARKVTVFTLDPSNNPVAGSSISTGTFGNPTVSLGGSLNATVNSSTYSGGPVTDNSGKTDVWVLPSNTLNSSVTLNATPPTGSGYLTTSLQNQNIISDDTKTINYLQPAVLSGHVYDEYGTAVSSQKVTFGSISSTTDANGFYSLSAAPGTQTLTIDNINAVPDYSKNIPTSYKVQVNSYILSQTKTQDITIPARKVSMTVLNALNESVQGAGLSAGTFGNPTVDLGGGLTGNLVSGSYSGGPVTNINGQTSVWVIPSASLNSFVNINVIAPSGSGYISSSLQNQNITVDTSKSITLQRNVILSGHVYDEYDNPISGQRVTFGTISSTTDASGLYTISGLAGIQMLSVDNTTGTLDDTKDIPTAYRIEINSYSLGQTKTQDLRIPAYKVTAHVQNAANNPVSGVAVTAGTYGNPSVDLGGGLIGNVIAGSYSGGSLTDNDGNTVLWILPTTTQNTYVSYSVTLPSDSPYLPFTLDNMQVTNDHTEIIALQYNHATPTTVASLVTLRGDRTYSDPTTVTLSATAASGYTVTNTYYTIDGGSTQIYSNPFTVSGEGEHTINYWSIDNSGVEETHNTKTFTIHVNQSPYINSLSGATISAGDAYIETGSFTDPDSTNWTATVDYDDGAGPENLPLNSDKTFSLSHQYTTAGTYTVTVVVKDDGGATGTTMATITVNAPPAIDPIQGGTINEGQTYSENGSFSDSDSTSWIAKVDYGDGTRSQNIALNPDTTFTLNHFYKDNGTYTVTVSITDNQGATSTTTATVTVNNVIPAVGTMSLSSNPTIVNTTVAATASFTDPGILDTHTAVFDWGDGMTSIGNIAENNGSGSVSGSHVYLTAGIYTVTLTVSDNQGGNGTSTFQYVSVYNPTTQGLFSAAHIFTSPAGAYLPNPSLTGQVQFGVTAKYNNSSQPTGNVSMKFKQANFEFDSSSFTVLVTANGRATLRGTGTVNGVGNYTFLVTGLDDAIDKIRFQIKDASDNVVYDSQPGVEDTADPISPVTGQVVIH